MLDVRVLRKVILVLLLAINPLMVRATDVSATDVSGSLKSVRIVVSSRALKPKGRSAWNLYLYDGAGQLKRKLTTGSEFDDVNPIFSPDGDTIGFVRSPTRYKNELSHKDGKVFLINSDGHKLRAYDGATSAPAWYTATVQMGRMEHISVDNQTGTTSTLHQPARSYIDPAGQYNLIVAMKPEDGKRTFTSQDRTAWLHNLKTNDDDRLSSLPGYGSTLVGRGDFGFQGVCVDNATQSPWISRPPFLAALFWCHLNSTDGSSVFALDPKRRRIHELSPNGARIYTIPDLPAMFVVNQERYQPLGDTGMSVNCAYFDLWSGDFKRRRLSPKLAVFGGASVWRSERKPVYKAPGDL